MEKKGKKTISVEEAGRRGGEATKERHGQQFYHEIGVKGGHTVRDLIKKGKELDRINQKEEPSI